MNDRIARYQGRIDAKRTALALIEAHYGRAADNVVPLAARQRRVRMRLNVNAILPPPAPGAMARCKPMTPAEMAAWSRWHRDTPYRDVLAFKLRGGTGLFGLIQGGRT